MNQLQKAFEAIEHLTPEQLDELIDKGHELRMRATGFQREVRIDVSGPTAAGKSAIRQLIEDSIRAKGFAVDSTWVEHNSRSPEALADCFASMEKQGVTISVREMYGR